MRRQGQDVMQVNLAGIRRDIVNLAHNYSNAQKAVRKATSNDRWGPSSTLMAEIADLTYNMVAFTEIMQMLWKRLNDHGKNWRHVYKTLVLLEYLIKTGSEKVAQQCKENIFAIQTLKDFQYMEGSRDQGINVREKAKQLVALLKDEERLRNERARALKAKERFAQSVSGFGSDGTGSAMGDACSSDWEPYKEKAESKPELETARPQTVGEEELQLQLALAMSREEAEQEEQRRRSDDVRLQLALSQSQQDFKAPPSEKASHILDLLDVSLGETSGEAAAVDPWGVPLSLPPSRPQTNTIDPWDITITSDPLKVADPWAPVLSQRPIAAVDPWQAPLPISSTVSPRTVDPWVSPISDVSATPPPFIKNSLLKQNIGLNAQSAHNAMDFDTKCSLLCAPNFPENSNRLNGSRNEFNNFDSPSSTNTSPLGELDEFDVISNRDKLGTSPPMVDDGITISSDPFYLGSLNNNLPLSTGAIKKTPQSFLGENSALVNLDNLVSTSMKPSAPVPAAVASFPVNPFIAVTPPPRPTINQIRQDPWIGNAAASSTANPFLS
ncbi:epsin-2 isoform X1 [Aphidius gifuensis]|nr:epsin-2 isoform X1 [Aphidius gifuensis]XP_044019193.1 epsin-2 isoform X1 [Aphidius gifuensis]XP_044019194.1 epsin-2 isoform X1 [Aphidius gifuensis]